MHSSFFASSQSEEEAKRSRFGRASASLLLRFAKKRRKSEEACKRWMKYGERGIRTLGTKKIVQRISNQSLSTTQPSLLLLRLLLFLFAPSSLLLRRKLCEASSGEEAKKEKLPLRSAKERRKMHSFCSCASSLLLRFFFASSQSEEEAKKERCIAFAPVCCFGALARPTRMRRKAKAGGKAKVERASNLRSFLLLAQKLCLRKAERRGSFFFASSQSEEGAKMQSFCALSLRSR